MAAGSEVDHLNRKVGSPDKQLCIAVAEWLSDLRSGSGLQLVCFPDDVDSTQPTVDAIFKDDIGRIVLEHTQVESFTEQISDEKLVESVFPSFEMIANIEPGVRLLIALAPGACAGIKPQKQDRVRQEIRVWLESNYQSIADSARGAEQMKGIHVAPPITPIALSLFRLLDGSHGKDGIIPVIRILPAGFDHARELRLRTAFKGKLPKLTQCTGPGDCSVLVLETMDLALGNVVLLVAAARRCSSDMTLSDKIVVVDTCGEMWGHIVYSAGEWLDLPHAGWLDHPPL